MMSNYNKRQERKLNRLANTILKRDNDWFEVSDYQLGDIQTELTVYVSKKAAVAGNVLAPRVIVAGIIYGFVASREIIIEPLGQIWGDVHTVALEVAPGGKLHGWMSTLDEGTVDLIRSGELDKGDLKNATLPSIPDELIEFLPGGVVPNLEDRDDEPRLLIWRQLRAEAAMALIARSEIEATFERRLRELVNTYMAQSGGERELEAEVVRLRKVSQKAIAQAKSYRSQYLLAKDKLDSAQMALDERQNQMALDERQKSEKSVNSLGENDLHHSKYIVNGDLESIKVRDEQIAKLRMILVEREIELEKSKERIINLSRQLQKTKKLATARIRSLENELAQNK